MNVTIRSAIADDFPRIREIAAAGGSADATDAYLMFIADDGRLVLASNGEGPVAFAGMVPVPADGGDVAMVTDLFVAPAVRGRGIGRSLLAAVLDGWPRRMTCSSQHPAALPVYAAVGMVPRWRLLYLEGIAGGGGPSLRQGPWAHDRPSLVRHFAATGGVVTPHAVVQLIGGRATVQRLEHPDAVAVMQGLLAALPVGAVVRACVPEHRPLAAWLQTNGFVVTDHDVFCSSPGVELPASVSCVHPGLA